MRAKENAKLRDLGRRCPPDYTQRATKLKLFGYVAAVMVVLAIAERVRDPQAWTWMWKAGRTAGPVESLNDRLPPPGQRTQHDSPDTFVSRAPNSSAKESVGTQLDPVERAWNQGWSDIFDHLQPRQQSLLFEMLYVARKNESLPPSKASAAAELIEEAAKLWDDYHTDAFRSVEQLTGDDQALWLDVLRQINDRFAKEVRPALQVLAAGQKLAEAESRALAELGKALVALATARIEDDTVRRPAEREIWFHELARVNDTDNARLRQQSAGHVPYLQLFKQPGEYRCRVVSLKGTAKLAYRVGAEPNYLGVKEYVIYWIHPESGPGSPVMVYAVAAPAGFPPLANRDRDGKTTQLDEDVEVTGVFFKRCAYPAKDGTRTAPLVIARTVQWRPRPSLAVRNAAPINVKELAALTVAALLITVCLAAVAWKRTQRRRPVDAMPSAAAIAALDKLSIGPSTHESLRELEEQSLRGAGSHE